MISSCASPVAYDGSLDELLDHPVVALLKLGAPTMNELWPESMERSYYILTIL
jgi:hypothetical protein